MKKVSSRIVPIDAPMTDLEFRDSFNQNMPEGYPHVTLEIMEKFKSAHPVLFRSRNKWNLDQHRKRMIEWLPQNLNK